MVAQPLYLRSPEKAEVISNQPAFQWSKLGLSFWMIVIANLTCDFLSAFDMVSIQTKRTLCNL